MSLDAGEGKVPRIKSLESSRYSGPHGCTNLNVGLLCVRWLKTLDSYVARLSADVMQAGCHQMRCRQAVSGGGASRLSAEAVPVGFQRMRRRSAFSGHVRQSEDILLAIIGCIARQIPHEMPVAFIRYALTVIG